MRMQLHSLAPPGELGVVALIMIAGPRRQRQMEPRFSLAGQPTCRDSSLFQSTRRMAPEGKHMHTHTHALTPAYMAPTHTPLMRLPSLGHSYVHPAWISARLCWWPVPESVIKVSHLTDSDHWPLLTAELMSALVT